MSAGNGQVVRRRGDRAQERPPAAAAAAADLVDGRRWRPGHGPAPRRRLPDRQAAGRRDEGGCPRGPAPHQPGLGGGRRDAPVHVLGVEQPRARRLEFRCPSER